MTWYTTADARRDAERQAALNQQARLLDKQGRLLDKPQSSPGGCMTKQEMKVGGRYNWRNQPDRLVYLGKKGSWHQFKKIGDPRAVWCEVLDEDLHMIEETTTATPPAATPTAGRP